MKVLVIGGAGVTGTPIVRQLLARGCDVTLLHRGVHRATAPDSVARIQADPYAKDGLHASLAGETV